MMPLNFYGFSGARLMVAWVSSNGAPLETYWSPKFIFVFLLFLQFWRIPVPHA